jgi:plastocyanin
MGLVLAGALVMSFAFVACGDDDDDDGDAGGPAAGITEAATQAVDTPAADTPAAETPAGDGVENLTVTAADFSFSADISSVAPGSVVEVAFTNSGSAPHTLTFYTDAEYTDAIPGGDSDRVSGGGSVNFTFEAPEDGTGFYRCEVHPAQMMGELAVE